MTPDEQLARIRELTRQRVRKHRERRKLLKNQQPGNVTGNVTCNVTESCNVTGNVTENIQQNQMPCNVTSSYKERLLDSESRSKGLSRISLDWRPNSNGLLVADQMGLHGEALEAKIQEFVSYYASDGRELADWQARWVWYLRQGKGKSNGSYRQAPTDRRERELQRWDDAKARLRGEIGGDNVRLFPA